MKKQTKLIIGLLVVLVIGYMIWKRREEQESSSTEEKAGAFGHACYCQGRYNGTCSLPGCCERKCRRKIISQMEH